MAIIIALVISFIGYMCYGIDFCTLYTFVSIALSLYDFTHDKTA